MNEQTRKFNIELVILEDGKEMISRQEDFVYWQVGQFLAQTLMSENLISFKVERQDK